MNVVPPDRNGQQALPASPADPGAAFRFLDFIFDGASDGFVEFQFFDTGLRPKRIDQPAYLTLPLENERITNEVISRNGRRMITVGLAPRCRIPGKGRAGRNQDVLQVGCIWANLDNSKAPGGAIEILGRIKDFPLRPSVAVNSGYGYHVYFVFHEPLRASDLLIWSELVRDLRTALRVNTVSHICEVMRLPGTLNIKEAHHLPCEVWEEYSSWIRYSIEEVRRAIDDCTRRVTSGAPSILPEMLKQRGVSVGVLEAIVTGRASFQVRNGYDHESGRDFWIASALLEKGFSESEIKTIFRAHPNGCGSNWVRKRGGEKYLDLTLQKATARHAEPKEEWAIRHAWPEGNEAEMDRLLPPGYILNEDSIWFNPPVVDNDKKLPKPVKVSNSLIRIAEIQENDDTGEISLLLAFDYLGKPRSLRVPRSSMADSRRLVNALAGAGAPVTSINARLVTAYLAAYEHAFASTIPHKKVTSRLGRGRAGGSFFLPGLSSSVEFAPAGPGDAALYRAFSSKRGLLQGWLEVMHEISDEALLIPQIAVLASLVPPLQSRLRIPNFILDIYGNSSTGKSTSLKLAASVYGMPHDPDSLILQWMNTQSAIEQVAGMCGDLPIFLDDAQHCPAELKRAIIYMIANGRGKGRSARGGGISEIPTWHTVALSTSEEPLYEASPHEGARGRILPIGGSILPFRQGSGSLVQALERAVAGNHGHAGEIYIRHLNGWEEGEWSAWQRRYSEIRSELLRSNLSGLVGRVSGYIAAIQLAAEVSCPLLGLRFKPDVVGAWLMLQLVEQQSSQNLVLLVLRDLADFYVANIKHFAGDGLYLPATRAVIYGSSKRQQYVGFLRSTIDAVFRQRKWNQTAMLSKMAEAGILLATEKDRFTRKVVIEGVKHRLVCVKWSALLPEDSSTLGTDSTSQRN
jgi:putative DNA primase/helicase